MNWDGLRYRVDAARRGHASAARRRGVAIGDGCRILSKVVTSEPWLVTIGDRVTVSSEVTLVTHDGSGWLVRDEDGRRYRYARIEIGSDVFIGARSIILPGVRIGDRVVVGAGSVVTKSIPAGTVVAGNPARRVADFESFAARLLKWPSEASRVGQSYRERVDSILDPDFRPDI